MEFTELSLAGKGSSGESEMSRANLPMKEKWRREASPTLDLQLQHPLPSDWEQCLDLQSGKMYYVNKKTSSKSWSKPQEQKLDLELNMSTGSSSGGVVSRGHYKEYISSSSSSSPMAPMGDNNMVALACANCHLLVILSRSSPSCPNCKYVHFLEPSPKSKSKASYDWSI